MLPNLVIDLVMLVTLDKDLKVLIYKCRYFIPFVKRINPHYFLTVAILRYQTLISTIYASSEM